MTAVLQAAWLVARGLEDLAVQPAPSELVEQLTIPRSPTGVRNSSAIRAGV